MNAQALRDAIEAERWNLQQQEARLEETELEETDARERQRLRRELEAMRASRISGRGNRSKRMLQPRHRGRSGG